MLDVVTERMGNKPLLWPVEAVAQPQRESCEQGCGGGRKGAEGGEGKGEGVQQPPPEEGLRWQRLFREERGLGEREYEQAFLNLEGDG